MLSYFKVCTRQSRFVPKYLRQLPLLLMCTPTDYTVVPFMFLFIAQLLKLGVFVSTCSIVFLFIVNNDFCLENGQREVTSMFVTTSQYTSTFEIT